MDLINEYLEQSTTLKDNTKEGYLTTLTQHVDMIHKDENELIDYLININESSAKQKTNSSIINSYRIYHKLENTKFNQYYRECGDNYVSKIKKKLTRKELIELNNNCKATGQHKLLLNLLLNYDQVIRCDLANIKWKNYDTDTDNYIEDGIIYFSSYTKVKSKKLITIELNDEDKELVKNLSHKGDYLLYFNTVPSERTANYSKSIPRLTLKYLGVKLTQNCMRHIAEIHDFTTTLNEMGISLDQFKDLYKVLNEKATHRCHTMDVVMKYYLD